MPIWPISVAWEWLEDNQVNFKTIMKINDDIAIVPMLGLLDSRHTRRFLKRFMEYVRETGVSVALVDFTGMLMIDKATVLHLIASIAAVRQMGVKVIITGIRPALAQTLARLGGELPGVTTCVSLPVGLDLAKDILKLRTRGNV